jgi:hypothetical protein
VFRVRLEKLKFSSKFIFIPFIIVAVLMFVAIIHYGVNTPFWDQWEMVPLFEAVSHHTLSLADLWRQHNEHRTFFPNIVLLICAYITHWNTHIEMLVGLCFAIVSASLIVLMLKKSIVKLWLGLIAAVLIAVWFFSPVQWEDWLWGWQVEWFMCVAAVTTSIFSLTRFTEKSAHRRIAIFVLAILSGIIGSYSLAGGLIVWPVGLFILVAMKQAKKLWGSWTVIGILAAALYYYHYIPQPGPNGATTTFFLHHPLSFIEFFFALIGGSVGSVSGDLQAPVLIGAILLTSLVPILYLVWNRRSDIHRYIPWLAFILFGLLAAASTDVGRLSYGVGFALSSRYTAFSTLFIIGVTAIIIILLDGLKTPSKEFNQVVVTCLLLVSLPLVISSYSVGIQGFRSQSQLLKEIDVCTHVANPANACLSLTYPSSTVVRPRLEFLKAKHWAGY